MLMSKAYDAAHVRECRSEEEAKNFRRELYNWRAALRRENNHNDAVSNLLQRVDALSIFVRGKWIIIRRSHNYEHLI